MMREPGDVLLPDGAGQYPLLDPPGRYHMPASSDVILEALHALGERGRHVLGQRERGWREVGKKEVRRVEETNVV